MRQRRAGWSGWILGAMAGLWGCGSPTPRLPGAPARATLPAGDAERGVALLTDRALGRTGLACADCHPVTTWRPAPSLTAATAERVDWCVERYLHRPALTATALADVLAAAATLGPHAPNATDPAALYAQACAHCHEAGPGEPVLGALWTRAHLTATIRGADRPAHPDTLMPFFDADALPDPALAALVDYVMQAPPRNR